MQNNQSRGLTIPKLISVGVFSAIYFLLVSVSVGICVVALSGFGYPFIYIPVVAALLSGSVYMMMVAKTQTFGAITIMAMVLGCFYFFSGLFPLGIIPSIVFGLLADYIAYRGHYQSKTGLLASYVSFSYACVGPIAILFFNRASFTQSLTAIGRSPEQIDVIYQSITGSTAWIVATLIFIAAIIGGLFGQKMLSKHFERAGIV